MNSLASSVLSCATTSATAFLLRDMTSSPSCSRSQRLTCVTELGLSSPVRAMAFSVSSALNRSSISEACAASVRSTRTPLSLIRASRQRIDRSFPEGVQGFRRWYSSRSATTSCAQYDLNFSHASTSLSGGLNTPCRFRLQNLRISALPSRSFALSCGSFNASQHCPSARGSPHVAASSMVSSHSSAGQ